MIHLRRMTVTGYAIGLVVLFAGAYLLVGGPSPDVLVPITAFGLMVGAVADVVRFRLRVRREVGALAEFLLARFLEDEQWVRRIGVSQREARIAADIEAKRRVVEVLESKGRSAFDVLRQIGSASGGEHAVKVMRILARPYADHRDFRPEWLDAASPRAAEVVRGDYPRLRSGGF